MTSAMWIFGIALAAVAVLFLAINKKQRDILLHLLKRSSGRVLSTSTPPLSLAEKQPRKLSNYNEVLPPFRREALRETTKNAASKENTKTSGDGDINEETVKQLILPMTANYETSAGNLFTPTGFSVDEIKSLGDPPDYAELSGIPPPDAYPEFDIDKALPRPYRPFRWNYHQTMCKCPGSFFSLTEDWDEFS